MPNSTLKWPKLVQKFGNCEINLRKIVKPYNFTKISQFGQIWSLCHRTTEGKDVNLTFSEIQVKGMRNVNCWYNV